MNRKMAMNLFFLRCAILAYKITTMAQIKLTYAMLVKRLRYESFFTNNKQMVTAIITKLTLFEIFTILNTLGW